MISGSNSKMKGLFKGTLFLLFGVFACNSFKDVSLLKSRKMEVESSLNQRSEFLRSFDHQSYWQQDSSSFGAWVLVDGDFTFHPDSGIFGEKAWIRYFGKRYSEKISLDSSSLEIGSEAIREDLNLEQEKTHIKEKEVRNWISPYWLIAIGLCLVLFIKMKR